jgi:hypothetical protein
MQKTEVRNSSATFVAMYQTTRRYIPEGRTLVQVTENGLSIPIPSINSAAIFVRRFNSLGYSTYRTLFVIYFGFCIGFVTKETAKLLRTCTRLDEDGYNI